MQTLIDKFKIPIGKASVQAFAKSIADDAFSVEELITCSFHQDHQIGFRAAWALEQVYFNHQPAFLPYAKAFLNCIHMQTNHSANRSFMKILADMTNKKASPEIKTIISHHDTTQILEVVFTWLIDNKVPVAVKSHCLSILANLVEKHDWIREELIQTMDFLIEKESIAFFAKVKPIRKQLAISDKRLQLSKRQI